MSGPHARLVSEGLRSASTVRYLIIYGIYIYTRLRSVIVFPKISIRRSWADRDAAVALIACRCNSIFAGGVGAVGVDVQFPAASSSIEIVWNATASRPAPVDRQSTGFVSVKEHIGVASKV